MGEKFNDKYRIPSNRLQGWDYSAGGAYFITICCHMHECYFGDVEGGEMQLNDIGKIANDFWKEIPEHFPFVELDAFQIMPNHVHGIIIIKQNNVANVVETPNFGVSTGKKSQTSEASKKWKSGSVGVIINQYKRIVTKTIRQSYSGFMWQSNYHDHIIRNRDEFYRIQQYILNNPVLWNDDRYHK